MCNNFWPLSLFSDPCLRLEMRIRLVLLLVQSSLEKHFKFILMGVLRRPVMATVWLRFTWKHIFMTHPSLQPLLLLLLLLSSWQRFKSTCGRHCFVKCVIGQDAGRLVLSTSITDHKKYLYWLLVLKIICFELK